MKSQVYNQGELKELIINIDKDVLECFERMSEVSGRNLADLVVIAMMRYRASHADYEGKVPSTDSENSDNSRC